MNVLVVAAHPDDEILGCGGTIRKLTEAGRKVHILIMAEGATSRDEKRDVTERAGEIEALRDAARAAARAIGAESPIFAGFPDNRMDGTERLDIIKAVEAVVADVQPRVVYTHHGNDLNIDHRLTHEAVLTACRPLPGSPVREIWAFETQSSSEWAAISQGLAFQPNRWVGIAAQWEAKRRALEAYASEMRPFPHARSIEAVEALAKLRGSHAGLGAAEAFMAIRLVEP